MTEIIRRISRHAAIAAALALSFAGLAAPARAAGPTVAVLDFSTQGLTNTWWGGFEPGIALSDLVTDQLVNGGKFNVVDRTHLDKVMSEHNLTTEGEVSPATAIARGRLIGARYLITGNVLQLDKTGQSGAAAGSLIGGAVGGILGGIKQERVTLKVQVRVIDAVTGQIVQSYAAEHTQSGTSWGAGGFAGLGAGGYGNQNFTNSTMGHLINDEAIEIAGKLDPSRFTAAEGAAPPALSARVIGIDGENVIINAGSAKGVATGMFFDVVKVLHIKDPDSGKMLSSNETVGKIQIVSVSGETAIGKRISGSVAKLETVQAEQ